MGCDHLIHHGIKGQKWGIRRTPEQLGHKMSNESPKIKLDNGDYLYKKGTVVGRFGEKLFGNEPTYLYTNKKDRDVYENRIGGTEYTYKLKKSVRVPDENKQFIELFKYTGDTAVIEDAYTYWKENINQGGKIADGYFKYMQSLGYDALVDSRNAGVISNDPIILLNPKKCLKEVK